MKYKYHPSILAVGEVCRERWGIPDPFSEADKEMEILQEILNLDICKTCQDTDVPTKIIRENVDVFSEFLHLSFNASVKKSAFESVLN